MPASNFSPEFWAELNGIVPPQNLSIASEDLAAYGRDWTRVYEPSPGAVVWPRSTEEVAKILATCHRHDVAVVPSGGRTGLAGGAVAKSGELVLSLERMRQIAPVDILGATVRVEAGVVTAAIHEHCAPHGLTWPVDFASKGSSQVGGNIATNAGGVNVIRYGLTRQWVLGLKVVLIDGTILNLGGGLEKNNTGVDLRQLFIGSEGTLGVITEATLKLTALPSKLGVLLFAVRGLAGVLDLFSAARKSKLTISAFEFFTDACLQRLLSHRPLKPPFSGPYDHYVLVEIEEFSQSSIEAWMHSVVEAALVLDGVWAQNETQAAELWQLREGISESLSATGLPHKNDIALPIAALFAFCEELDQLLATRYPGIEVCNFGHIGDGNLHVNFMKPAAMDKADFLALMKSADQDMFSLVKRHGGSISAEHGIGLLKRDFLHFSRTPEELHVMAGIKKLLDPKGLLNPGKILR